MSDIQILKLKDGSTIVGKVTVSPEMVEIEHPIELVSQTVNSSQGYGEQINLRPWIAISEEQTFVIERYNIITMSTLQKGFGEGYHRMVEQIYFNETNWVGPMAEEEIEDMDIDTLTELAEAMMKNKIH